MHGRLAGLRRPVFLPGKLYDGFSISEKAHGIGSGSKEGICIKASVKRRVGWC